MKSVDMPGRQITSVAEEATSVERRRKSDAAASAWITATWMTLTLLTLSSLFFLTGCMWIGKGKDVADALKKTAAVRTAAFSGSLQMQAIGNAGNDSMQMTFSGASDVSDLAAPKSQMEMVVGGQKIDVTAPGDGNIYMATPAGAFGAPIDANSARADAFGAVLTELGSAIGGFQEGAASTTADGLTLRTISAEADSGKICNQVVPSFSKYLDTASSGSNGLKSLTGSKSLSDVCNSMLVKKPRLWFGIDNDGMLRMIAVKASLSLMALGSVDMTMRFDLTSVNQPVRIVAPPQARMLPSQQALQQAMASGLSGGS